MNYKGKIIAQIPARAGSVRVAKKNLRYLVGQPMLQYAIDAAKGVEALDEIIVNSDSPEILEFADMLNISNYKRPSELANNTATGDDFTYDFIKKFNPKTLVLVNPACPLIESHDISKAIEVFIQNDCDTLISSHSTKMPTFCENIPVNISLAGQMQPTQNNPSVVTLNWAVAIWDTAKYIENYETTGSAYMGVNRYLHEIDPWKSIKISVESDFRFAELLLSAKKIGKAGSTLLKYWDDNEK